MVAGRCWAAVVDRECGMADLAFVVLILVVFALLGLAAKGAERL